MMKLRWNVLWLVSLGVLLLVSVYLSRKPQCIDSRVVERIDRLDTPETETVWRCSLNRDTPWNAHLSSRLPNWEARIARIEENLWRLEPFRRPLRLVILPQRPWAYRLQRGTLYIGDKMIEAEGHLERGLVKAWLRERDPNLVEGDLVEEVLTDFLLGTIDGNPEFEDTARGLRTRLGARWPQTLKDSTSYCESPWKLSEHYETCMRDVSRFEDRAWKLSLRPLLTTSLLAAWIDLPLRQRLESFREISHWTENRAAFPAGNEIVEGGLTGAAATLIDFQKRLSQRTDRGGSAAMTLSANFTENLRRLGFREVEPMVSLDVMILSDIPLDANSKVMSQLTSFAAARPGMKIAVKDPRHLSLLPTKNRLLVDNLDGLRASRVAVLRCGRFDFDWVLSFATSAQKLFVVDVCSDERPDMRSWVVAGAEGFAAANPKFRFIQFHLPSLAARKADLALSTDVLSLIQKRDIADPLFQSLGWQELNWSDALKAYHPRAHFDAIEWFRIN